MKYIVVCFAFMALAFYELSGGDDFVPRKAELIAAAKAEDAAKEAARSARLAQVEPAPTTVPPAVAEVSLRTAPQQNVIAQAAPSRQPQPTQAALETDAPVTATLISLEQDGAMFARPLTQLGATPEQVRPTQVIQPSEPTDLREVAGSRVNMRQGPGTSFGVVTSLPQGTAVEIIDADGTGWVKLRTVDEDLVGWMAEYLLTEPTG